ncbi:VCBS repeat-containing protein [Mucilaginibacter phyllosphaerae]
MIEDLLSRSIQLVKFNFLAFIIICAAITPACKTPAPYADAQPVNTLFTLLPANETHVDFSNILTEGLNTNVLMYEYFYNGGGVAVGDLNGDGLQDLYFTGNMVDNKFYLNKGNLQFADVTTAAGVAGRPGPWKTGVSLADVNGDGKLDVYVCYSGKLRAQKRGNQLFINQGNDANGVPVFKEMAAHYGLNFSSFSTQGYFFDYDKDGDLDLLLINHNPKRENTLDEVSVADLMSKPDPESGIRLLKNNNGFFADVTASAGIVNTSLSYGLAAGIADINGDGNPDIYISNDYNVPDRLYISNGKGKFIDELQRQIGHISFSSMGNDIADFNNDLLPDIYSLDMLPADNRRQKMLFAADNYEAFNLSLKVGFYYQYMRNMLQQNNGNNTFSEIGQLAGVSNTDWSWAPLFADYDNDGWKDMFVSNGYTRDYTNMDFLKYVGDNLRNRQAMRQDLLNLVEKMPSSDVKSYFFKNRGNSTFADVSSVWGIDQPANSNGAAYADLDNDGDLDLVVNNINKPAFIYQNNSRLQSKNHYLAVKLKGAGKNTQGVGAKVIVYAKNKKQYLEQMPTRGYQSTVTTVLHFGLGADTRVDSLRVIWQTGKTQMLVNLNADQSLILDEKNALTYNERATVPNALFKETSIPFKYTSVKSNVNDFKRQPLMVNPLSYPGPCMAKADVNSDGLEDIYIGGDSGKSGSLYLQQKNGSFVLTSQPAFTADSKCTNTAALFFDANGDGKVDLYVCSGGYHDYAADDAMLQDRLYINNGTGAFTKNLSALPKMLSSKGCVKAADINGDGFSDLFIGGRVVPGGYPQAPESYILINDGKGTFTDKTAAINPSLKNIGMISCAQWADMNGDKKPDLIVAGEWMPIMIFENKDGKLENATNKYFEKNYTGWWNCLAVADINKDGKPDILAGNMGLNTQCKVTDKEPAEMYYKDFDDNGSIDPILCFYVQHKSYPYITRDELLDQMSIMRTRFPDYNSYADAPINVVFTPQELKGAGHLKANYLATACFTSNIKNSRLLTTALPAQAQYSPVFTTTTLDYDGDGNTDLLLCGNIEHSRVRFGKYDANYGVLLKGDGKGNFNYISQQRSGFKLEGDVRSVIEINGGYLFGVNGKGIKAYKQ